MVQDIVTAIKYIMSTVPYTCLPFPPRDMSAVIDAYPCFSNEQLVALATKEQDVFSDSPDPASLGRMFYVTGSWFYNLLPAYFPSRIYLHECSQAGSLKYSFIHKQTRIVLMQVYAGH